MNAKVKKPKQSVALAAPAQELIPKKPNQFSQEMADVICLRLAEGESLNNVCRDPTMPRKGLVFDWLMTHPVFADQYARACTMRTEHWQEELYEAATDGRNDYYDRPIYNNKGEIVRTERVLDPEAVARSRLRVDALKWLMSKMNPRKYGDKLDVNMDATVRPAAPLPDPNFAAMDPVDAVRVYQEFLNR